MSDINHLQDVLTRATQARAEGDLQEMKAILEEVEWASVKKSSLRSAFESLAQSARSKR